MIARHRVRERRLPARSLHGADEVDHCLGDVVGPSELVVELTRQRRDLDRDGGPHAFVGHESGEDLGWPPLVPSNDARDPGSSRWPTASRHPSPLCLPEYSVARFSSSILIAVVSATSP